MRALQTIEQEDRPATPDEREALAQFPGFGPLARLLFPDPVSGRYKDPGWQQLGEQLASLLTPEEYASAKRTTFTAFYTSPVVMQALYDALARFGVPQTATVLEPGCGSGRFMQQAPPQMRFIGVELDGLSGRIARALYPAHDIRIENFRDTRLPEDRIDAVIGNVPFADVKLDYHGKRLALHDFFLAKSLDGLKPGGVVALVTSHYTLDKQNAAVRESLAEQADFLGAIRLPSDAFTREGTNVVTDLLFLRKRTPGEPARQADPDWLATDLLNIDGAEIPINRYFLRHPEMVLGRWSRQNRLYDATYSVTSTGELAEQLREALERLPSNVFSALASPAPVPEAARPSVPLSAGSLFIAEDQTICQVLGGDAVPVTHGSTPLKANGTLMGKRLAGLITLRDQARRVLQSQNEAWPEAEREAARAVLNRTYDRFVAQYGPINKTTFSTTESGTVIRRMPNLVKFRDDPDAMLVLSLEDYDEVTEKADKAAIMHHDVVGRSPPVTAVRSAAEGLLVSLDQHGTVDLPLIARLYDHSVRTVIEELGDLIYQDPESGDWQTADAYLSGNVRAKLKTAEQAGAAFARNVAALREVQPEDVLPGEIDANLGAPWIPATDLRAFAAALFHVPVENIRIGHLAQDAVWSVEASAQAQQSVAATAEYGTPRINGVQLLEQALNLKTPVIYDTTVNDERVVNQEATLAAREKQKQLKAQFRAWVFADPDRTERLVRLYNDTYNNLRLRRFDGSHLAFPGMNHTIQLRAHQKDAIWRAMSSGNTLLAHAVGAGKTFTMAATGMKLKQAGLVKKPLYVVPNHMLEQFSREFMQLYPNAKLLVAGKEDFSKQRRKLLTAKIASGAWDGIILTHSSFERIGMSRAYQERFLREQIASYDRLLVEHAGASGETRNLIKTIEKQKARREARLEELLAQDKKDDGLVFDELGVDQLFIDEAHFFKNLETPTKMTRVAGIQTTGSERAFDLFMKTHFLHEQHPGRGVVFATGTPVSNTMVELYTLQRYLDPEGLAQRGLGHFDAWAATFGDIVETMEIAPDGQNLKPRSRFARFTNLPELQQLFRAFADVQTAAMLDLPCPRLSGGKATVVSCPMSDGQARLQEELVKRYDRLRSEKVDPREDNALAITTDGRKLALDARLLDPSAREEADAKVNALVERVADIWRETTPTRGTQLVFCDLGVNPTGWGYCVYDEIIEKLVKQGIPREQIAAIGSAETDAKKQALFAKVRSGAIRVLLGSTQKMGTGTNVQERLVALHHLDAPWKPAEVEQREGRILRQGNRNEEVAIYRYVTEGSFDAYMWQALETKARFIAQIITGDSTVRQAEDIGGQELSYAEVKAIASGNPAVLSLAEADAELKRLTVLKKQHGDEQYLARRRRRALPDEIARLEKRLAGLEADRATAEAQANAPLVIGKQPCPRDKALGLLAERLDALPKAVGATRQVTLGSCQGVAFGLELRPQQTPEVFVRGALTYRYGLSREHQGPRAVWNAVQRLIGSWAERAAQTRSELALARAQLRDYDARQESGFAHEQYLTELTELRNRLEKALSGGETASETAALVRQMSELKAAQTIEALPERTHARSGATPAEPVTARIHREQLADAGVSPEPGEQAKTALPPDATAAVPVLPAATQEEPEKPAAPRYAVQPALFTGEEPRARKAKPSYRQRHVREKHRQAGQLSLFS